MEGQWVVNLVVMIDQRSSPEHFVRFVANWPLLALQHPWVWGVVDGLKNFADPPNLEA